jgi:Trk K+ transport system NAD-binding subunit
MLSGDVAAQLRGLGHDVTAVVDDAALVGTTDEELLVHATAEGRLLVTANVRDFAAIHVSLSGRGRSHAGVI